MRKLFAAVQHEFDEAVQAGIQLLLIVLNIRYLDNRALCHMPSPLLTDGPALIISCAFMHKAGQSGETSFRPDMLYAVRHKIGACAMLLSLLCAVRSCASDDARIMQDIVDSGWKGSRG